MSTKTYVVFFHKNPFIETALLSTQTACEDWWFEKTIANLHSKCQCLTHNCMTSYETLNANGLDPDQDQQKIGPDLDPNRLTL